MRLPILTRGLGLSYFAFAPKAEQDLILSILRKSSDPETSLARNPARLEKIVEQVIAQGFATRPADMEPRNSNTISVPIFNTEDRVIASLGLTYFRSAFASTQEATERYVPLLRSASKEITVDLERLSKTVQTGGADG